MLKRKTKKIISWQCLEGKKFEKVKKEEKMDNWLIMKKVWKRKTKGDKKEKSLKKENKGRLKGKKFEKGKQRDTKRKKVWKRKTKGD